MKSAREVTVARVPELECCTQDVEVTEQLKGLPQPELTSIAVERRAGVAPEDSAEMKHGRSDSAGNGRQAVAAGERSGQMRPNVFRQFAMLRSRIPGGPSAPIHSVQYFVENGDDGLFDIQLVRALNRPNVLEHLSLREERPRVGPREIEAEQSMAGVGRARVTSRKHLSQHGRCHAEPVGPVTVAADLPASVRMSGVVQRYDCRIGDERQAPLVLNPDRRPGKDETVRARRPRVGESRVGGRAAELSHLDKVRLEENVRWLGGQQRRLMLRIRGHVTVLEHECNRQAARCRHDCEETAPAEASDSTTGAVGKGSPALYWCR